MKQILINTHTGRAHNEGETLISFRGEMYTFRGVSKDSGGHSEGKILTDKGEYYPSVFDAKLYDLVDPR